MRITTGEGTERFDAVSANHYHFCCSGCGKVTDLPLSRQNSLEHEVESMTGATVERHTLIFYGKCAECTANSAS
jgi:Fur family peroxide stress response transcriptional regulator